MKSMIRKRGKEASMYSADTVLLTIVVAFSLDVAVSTGPNAEMIQPSSHLPHIDIVSPERSRRHSRLSYDERGLGFFLRHLKKDKEKAVKENEEELRNDADDCFGWSVEEIEKCKEEGRSVRYKLNPDRPPDRCGDREEGTAMHDAGWYDVCDEWDRLYGGKEGTSARPSSAPSAATFVSVAPSVASSATIIQVPSLMKDSIQDASIAPSNRPAFLSGPSEIKQVDYIQDISIAPTNRPTSLSRPSEIKLVEELSRRPSADPTVIQKVLPELMSIPLNMFSIDLVFLTVKRHLRRSSRRHLFLDINGSELERIVQKFLDDEFTEVHPDFYELSIALTFKEKIEGVRSTTISCTFIGNVIFSGSSFLTLPGHDMLMSIVLESFSGTDFRDRLRYESKDPILASVQSVLVRENTGTASNSAQDTVAPQRSENVDSRVEPSVVGPIISIVVSVVLIAVGVVLSLSWKPRKGSSFMIDGGSNDVYNFIIGLSFPKLKSFRISNGAKDFLETSSAHGSSRDTKVYQKFEGSDDEGDGTSQFSGLVYGPSTMGEDVETVLQEDYKSKMTCFAINPRSEDRSCIADDDTLMNMSELGKGERFGQVLQLDCVDGTPNTKKMDFNYVWGYDESQTPEDTALSDTSESAPSLVEVRVEQRGNFTLELLRSVSRNFRPEDSQSDHTDMTADTPRAREEVKVYTKDARSSSPTEEDSEFGLIRNEL